MNVAATSNGCRGHNISGMYEIRFGATGARGLPSSRPYYQNRYANIVGQIRGTRAAHGAMRVCGT